MNEHNEPLLNLVLSSRNAKKARELYPLLAPAGVALRSVSEFPAAPEVNETGETFAANAALKASIVATAIGEWTIADDSGLMVDALGGAPGVYSARFAGEQGNDAANNAKLLELLANVPAELRAAQFVCAIAVADPNGNIRARGEGICRGRIVKEYRGGQGFGYDPLFLVPEFHRTFGELGLAVKSCLSHRARAIQAILPQIKRLATENRAHAVAPNNPLPM